MNKQKSTRIKQGVRNEKNVHHVDYTRETVRTKTKTKIRPKKEHGTIDKALLGVIIVILVFGLMMVLSASAPTAGYDLFFNQLRSAILGVVAMIILMFIDYKKYKFRKRWYWIWYVLAILSIISVLVPGLGIEENGAKRWIKLGVIFQPSEITKVAMIFFFAGYFSNNSDRIKDWRFGILYPILFGAVPIGMLLLIQNHLSAGIIIALTTYIMMLVAGTNRGFMGISALVGAGGLGALYAYAATHKNMENASFRIKRLISFMNPDIDPQDSGYQIKQSLYAIGSGGVRGVGFGESKQKYLYIPEPQNDFIFAIIAEELGLIGCIAVIVAYGILIWRGMLISMRCKTTFGELLAIGLTSLVAVQVILNILVVTSSMPVTGITLPFISYGGTALAILLACMGVLLNISRDGMSMKEQNIDEYRKGSSLE